MGHQDAEVSTRSPTHLESVKQRLRAFVDALPDDVTIDQAIERLLLLVKIERGLEDANAGKVVPHEDAKRRLRD